MKLGKMFWPNYYVIVDKFIEQQRRYIQKLS